MLSQRSSAERPGERRQAGAPPVRGRRPGRRARAAVVHGDRDPPADVLGALQVGDRRVADAVGGDGEAPDGGVGGAQQRIRQPCVGRRTAARPAAPGRPRAAARGPRRAPRATARRARRRRRRRSRRTPRRAAPARRRSARARPAPSGRRRGSRRRASSRRAPRRRRCPAPSPFTPTRGAATAPLAGAPSIAAGIVEGRAAQAPRDGADGGPAGAVVDRLAEDDPGVGGVVLRRRCRASRPTARRDRRASRASRRR